MKRSHFALFTPEILDPEREQVLVMAQEVVADAGAEADMTLFLTPFLVHDVEGTGQVGTGCAWA